MSDDVIQALWSLFTDPPDEARPRVWWHWMDGNVDPEGIRLDLEWLQRIGVRGVQAFDGGMGTPLVVPEPVVFGSPAWHEARDLAARIAEELGLELTVATSAGWSAAGGPWVPPGDAMRKIVWSETVASDQVVRLSPLPDVAGPFQDLGRWGQDAAPGHVADWLAIAVRDDPRRMPLVPGEVVGSSPIDSAERLGDGRFGAPVSLPRATDAPSEAWIEYRFAEPTTVAAVTVGLPGPGGFGAAPAPDALLERSEDGASWAPVARLVATDVPVRTASFAPVSARRFRLRLTGDTAAAALPRLAAGVRVPPVLRAVDRFTVSELALFADARVHAAECKAGFGILQDYSAAAGGPDAEAAIDAEAVVDVSALVDADGVLHWSPPPGSWRILRFGASLTGSTNGPAPAEATGLEVDKLDGAAVRRHLDAYLAIATPTGALHGLLSDSIESGPQNWTPRLREEFEARRGYDLLPWLPAVAGMVVRDAAATDRFLFDLRRTIADLVAEQYYGTIRDEAHRRGLTYYAEALEDHRPQLGDDLAMRAAADVPMGAMWLFDPGAGSPAPTYVADLKGASSVAHVYGKRWTGAESMTAFHRPWSYSPRHLKHVADLELALGVTRFCIHTSPHQPVGTPPPGIGLAPFLGQAFLRTEPWAELAGPWIDYLARCSAVLNAGTPAVDLAVLAGEEAPLTALFGDEPDTTVPPEIGFDYIGLEALESLTTVVDGDLVVPGARYRALVLGGWSRWMTCRALRRLAALVREGATVIGERPTGTPSLTDTAEEHARLVSAIWDTTDGADRVVETADVPEALRRIGFRPDRIVRGEGVRWIGRRLDGREITFVANGDPEERFADIRSTTALVGWDPVSLRRESVPAAEGDGSGHAYRLRLGPLESVLLVDDDRPRDPSGEIRAVQAEPGWTLEMPDRAPIRLDDGPQPWTELGADGFAGTGRYSGTVLVPDGWRPQRVVLRLTEVGDVARVHVNGTACGTTWTVPFECDVTDAIRSGINRIDIDVAGTWMNRLIAEAQQPTGEIFAPVASVYEPDAPIRPAGLAGPVVLVATLPPG